MKQSIVIQEGETIQFNDAREHTDGHRSEGVVTLAAGKKGPGAHIHTKQLEGFEIISGRMIATVNGREIVAKPGDTFIVQPNEPHTFDNGSSTEPLVAKFWYEPALNMEWCLQTMGEITAKNGEKISILPVIYMMFKLRREYRLAGLPFWLQDVLFGIGAGIAKLTGAAKKVILPADLA